MEYTNKGLSIQELLNVAIPALQNVVMVYDAHSGESLIKYAVSQMREALDKM
ncbi:MAG: hypothetical protein IJD05_06180 [Bacteroidaceae bacterium]|nr:hypothetical protein [Bacteroidaceae bacterium]MBQ4039073.1 hypothetical protein [Bacteroidaceae bacterium]